MPGRFIPTRVGQTSELPRDQQIQSGSSPRVWGRRKALDQVNTARPVHPHACGADQKRSEPGGCRIRFIPTRVGQTRCRWRGGRSMPVHPHACGADLETVNARLGFVRFIPTRVGQTLLKPGQVHRERRFIPTRVGQTCSRA